MREEKTITKAFAEKYKKVRISPDRVIIADVTKRAKRKREKTYDDIVFGVLKKIWLTIVAGLTQSLGLC